MGNGGDDRDARLGRILDDHLKRLSRGDSVSDSELYVRHPDLADDLREMLAAVQGLRSGTEIESLIKRGVLAPPTKSTHLAELGVYQITGRLGEGGMGVVFKACETSLNREIALKILKPDSSRDPLLIARFQREANAAAGLQHPNIVTVHAVGCENGAHFIAMEYVDGMNLREVIKLQGPLPTEMTRRVFREMMRGLGAAHEQELIHRDVKSSNVLLSLRSTARSDSTVALGQETTRESSELLEGTPPDTLAAVKLADFGLARLAGSQTTLTAANSILGTPEYMSPEQARGEADIDHRTDLYSAGVVLYEMLTGRVPFKADTPTAVLHQIIHVDPPDPRAINKDADPALVSLALRLMTKERRGRLQSSDEVIEALRSKRLFPPRRRPWSLRRRTSWMFASIAATAVIGAGILIGPSLFAPSRISGVLIDEAFQTRLLVERGYGNKREFVQFPTEVEKINTFALLDPNGDDSQVVAVGLERPYEGCNVFLYNARGREIRRIDLSNGPGNRDWPDCKQGVEWSCRYLVRADIDGVSGAEIIAIARNSEDYPSRISIINPRNGDVPYNLWHLGHIEGLLVVPNFFDATRPALVVWGRNNKLDGFGHPPSWRYEEPYDDGPPQTRFDQVSVAMILDPLKPDGIGPPFTTTGPLADIDRAQIDAYAILDAPIGDRSGTYWDSEAPVRLEPPPPDILKIAEIKLLRPGTENQGLEVRIERPGGEPIGEAQLVVDERLELDEAWPTSGGRLGSETDDWGPLWKVLIRDGEYLKSE